MLQWYSNSELCIVTLNQLFLFTSETDFEVPYSKRNIVRYKSVTQSSDIILICITLIGLFIIVGCEEFKNNDIYTQCFL